MRSGRLAAEAVLKQLLQKRLKDDVLVSEAVRQQNDQEHKEFLERMDQWRAAEASLTTHKSHEASLTAHKSYKASLATHKSHSTQVSQHTSLTQVSHKSHNTQVSHKSHNT